MRRCCILYLLIILVQPLLAEVFYLRSELVAAPGHPDLAFINPPGKESIERLRKSDLFGDVPSIIPASVIREHLPPGSGLVGQGVQYIPQGIVPQDSVEEVAALLSDIAGSGNGRQVTIRIVNWRRMIASRAEAPAASRGVRGGEQVRIVARNRNMSVEMQGKALESGDPGERISVLVESTRKRVRCRVISPGEVLLEL